MTSFSNKEWDKKIDNGLKREELEDKYGMDFSNMGDIPPEIETEWLKSIENFEAQHQNAERISVLDFIGNPDYKKLDELLTEEIPEELQRLFQILNENQISLNTICEVEKKELYRFITEELFKYEMDNIRIDGMMSCFTYEEFHPNAKFDIESAYDHFFTMTMSKAGNFGLEEGYNMLYVDFDYYKDASGNILGEKVVRTSINNFLNSFDRFDILSNQIKSIVINEEENDAVVNFYIQYQGILDQSNEKFEFKGDAFFKLRPSVYGGWSIYNINMPGLEIK